MGDIVKLPRRPFRDAFLDVENSQDRSIRFRRWLHFHVFPRSLYRTPKVGFRARMAMYHSLYGDPLQIRELGHLVRQVCQPNHKDTSL